MHIPILKWVQNGRLSSWKNGHILLEMYFSKLNFLVKGLLYANRFLCIMTVDHKFLYFQFWSRGIRILIPILTAVQHEGISSCKNCHILLKMHFFNLNIQVEGQL